MIEQIELANAALALTRTGLAVFPVWSVRNEGARLVCACPKGAGCTNPGKHPMTRQGLRDASTDPEQVSYWWRNRPDANIGLVTGTIIVIDVDPRHGGDRALAEIESKHSPLPSTWRVTTGGGGEHIYFRAAPGHAPIRNSAGRLGPGIDVRGAGGYVLAPPSRHVSGERYCWRCDPRQAPLCRLPPWIFGLLDQPAKAKSATEWRSIVQSEIAEGQRNDTLARLAGHLLRHYVDPHVVLDLLLTWNAARCRPPLDPAEVLQTAKSILHKEIQRRSA
jgi:Bifunctional DNA primase/polymerase, N-terminal/Primase C terminal 1 (PriCT-1)